MGPMVPFMCMHGMPVDDIIIEDEADEPLIEIPSTMDRLMPDGVSESTAASMSAAKASRDLSKMLGRGRVAVEKFKRLLTQTRLARYDYTYLLQLKPDQLTRMIALVEKGMEEAKLDLEMEGQEVFEEDGRVKPSGLRRRPGEPTPMPPEVNMELAPSGGPGQARRDGPLGGFALGNSAAALSHLRSSQEQLESDNHQFDLISRDLAGAVDRGHLGNRQGGPSNPAALPGSGANHQLINLDSSV